LQYIAWSDVDLTRGEGQAPWNFTPTRGGLIEMALWNLFVKVLFRQAELKVLFRQAELKVLFRQA
jgi:hypothetical protein